MSLMMVTVGIHEPFPNGFGRRDFDGIAAAADGAGGIATNIAGLATAAQVTTDGVAHSQQAVTELSVMARDLQRLVADFRT
jgi:methyl-accepting chemotaxis protein